MNRLKRFIAWKSRLAALINTEPVVFTHSDTDTGVYFRCNFDDEGNPDWQEIIDMSKKHLEAQKAQGG